MTTARLLPEAEWDKLKTIEPFASNGLPNAEHWLVPVVEDQGRIVASCGIFDAVHWDCFQIDDAYQANPVVFKQLLAMAIQTLQDHDVPGAHLTVPHNRPDLQAMVERFGFVEAPGKLYLIRTPPRID